MLSSRPNVDAFTSADSVQRVAPACPRCGEPLVRIPRLWSDRLRSLVQPVRRYRCDWLGCNWMGTLSDDERAHPTAPDAPAADDPDHRT